MKKAVATSSLPSLLVCFMAEDVSCCVVILDDLKS